MSQARAILRNLHALNERRYVGDTNASDTLVDFADAVKRASLTARQSEALRLVYVEDLTQKVAGERMGIERSALTEHLRLAIESIDELIEYIAWHNGELIAEELMEAEEIGC